ncbi:MAG TPA: hypothetical protein DF292_03880 [Firmicutes bacterium]|jgi:GNAT superfamily N-acetyltransferase|nr:hypothetical protein [Bacillota bacterium]HCT36158.1 hypothetical protein [Bacillota bacterium]
MEICGQGQSPFVLNALVRFGKEKNPGALHKPVNIGDGKGINEPRRMPGIHKNFQNKGIGSALMSTVIDLADNWLMLIRTKMGEWRGPGGSKGIMVN